MLGAHAPARGALPKRSNFPIYGLYTGYTAYIDVYIIIPYTVVANPTYKSKGYFTYSWHAFCSFCVD